MDKQGEPSGNAKKEGWLHSVAAHPYVVLSGWIATVASLIFGIVIWYLGREVRELTFSVNPVRTSVVRAGQTSKLKVSYSGTEVSNDVTAVQIALWNAGKRPIRKSEILEPITLSIPNAQILEATLRHVSRPVTGLALDESQMQSGVIRVSWNILEKGDGCSIQVIYAGSPSANITQLGIVEGQSRLRASNFPIDRPSRLMVVLWLGIWVFIVVWSGKNILRFLKSHLPLKSKVFLVTIFLLPVALLSLMAIYTLRASMAGPPFGF